MPSRVAAVEGMDQFAASVLSLAQVGPRPIPLTDTGRRLACTRMIFRRNGPMRLVGVLRNSREAQDLDPGDQAVTLKLGQTCHVYELVKRAYLGQTDTYHDTFSPTTHRALVLLPYKVDGVRLELTGEPRVKCGESITIQARILANAEQLAEHRLQVDVRRPDDKRAEGYDDLLVLRNGTATMRLPIALNADPGEWRVTMTDAVSALSGHTLFTVYRPAGRAQ